MFRKLLIVDDNKINRETLKGTLHKDYEILEAEDGQEAYNLLLRNYKTISAVLLDIAMPVMDGYEVLRRMKENPVLSLIPVIMVTGNADENDRLKALALGANDFITKPYNPHLVKHCLRNNISLRENASLLNGFQRDHLTGLYNRDTFFEKAGELIRSQAAGYYTMASFDIDNFKLINDQYGTAAGDQILKSMARTARETFSAVGGIVGRITADNFASLFPSKNVSDTFLTKMAEIKLPGRGGKSIPFSVGRYVVTDKSLNPSTIYDRALIAKRAVKGRYDEHMACFDDAMLERLLKDQRITQNMDTALADRQFEVWFQPQYNHATGALIGAEALARWRDPENGLIPPCEFIPLFERSGFIYELDKYVWGHTCAFLRECMDKGQKPVPISVNISRYDVLRIDLVDTIMGLVADYDIPVDFLRLEITESAFSDSSVQVVSVVKELIGHGFIVEIDDFGSGYSSLNTLKDVPAQVLKLDMKFFDDTENSQRSGNIVESIVRMAKWLGMAVIAEGVETTQQADFLKSIGCYYIQGYLYSRPIPEKDYRRLCEKAEKEPELTRLKTVESLDNNAFWDPNSMETLIFNSYVGGACIFEYCKGKTELLRVNDRYAQEFGHDRAAGVPTDSMDPMKYLDEENQALLFGNIRTAIESHREASCEIKLTGLGGDAEKFMYLRTTVRAIARAGDHYLFYCVVLNTTEKRMAEHRALDASQRIKAVMDNSKCGITAVTATAEGTVEYLFVNNRFFEMLGYTQEQFEKEVNDPFGCIVPEDKEKTVSAALALKDIGQTLTLQMRARRRDGRIIWLRADISMVRFATVEQPVQLGNFMDITEQVEAEKKELESAQKLEVIMGNINGGVSAILIDDEGRSKFVFNNDKYYALYGSTRQQIEAENIDVMTMIVPEDLPGVMAKIRKLKADKKPSLIDYRITKPDGTMALLRANASLMSLDGYGDQVITSVVTDITEKRSLEEQLRAIVDNIYGGVSATVIKNGRPEFVVVNDQFFKILGYDSREEYELECGDDRYARIHPDDRAKIVQQFESSDGGRTRYTMEYRIIRRDGETRYIRNNINVISLFGVDGPVQLSVANDLTEIHLAQIKEREAADKLSAVLNHAGNGITAVALRRDTLEFLFANDKFFEIIGYSKKEYQEKTVLDMLAIVHPDDREDLRVRVTECNEKQTGITAEYRVIRGDGKIVWIRSVITITRLAGVDAPVQISMFSDITAEKEAGDQLRFLNDSAHDILAQPDSDLAVNKTLENLIAYFAGDRAYVIELDYNKQVSNDTYEMCAPGVESEIELLQNVPLAITDYWLDTLNRDEFVVIEDVESLGDDKAQLRDILLKQNIRSLIVAPLWRDGTLMGFAALDNPSKAIDQLDRLKALADYIAVQLTRRDMSRRIEQDRAAMRQLVDDTPGGFCRMEIHPGKDPTLVSVNQGMCRMLGMTEEEAMAAYGSNAHLLFTPEDIAETAPKTAAALASLGQYSCDCQLHCKGGKMLWVTAFGRFVKAGDGRIFLNSYFTDITKQKHAQEQQIELLDNLPTGAALYEYDGKSLSVIHINKSYWELVERERVDYSNASVINAIHPADRAIVHQEIDSAIRQNRSISADLRILCGKNDYKPFHIAANVTKQENGKYLLYASYTPISGQTMSVQEMLPIALSTMMSASDDLSYVKDRDGRYLCCSDSLANSLGLLSARDIIGKSDFDLFEQEAAQEMAQRTEWIIQHGEAITGVTERVPVNGVLRMMSASGFPLRDTDGNVIGIYGISRDITLQKEKDFQLELLTNSIPGGIATFICSPEGIKLAYYNEGLCQLSGFTRQDHEKGIIAPHDFVFKEDKPLFDSQLTLMLKDGTPMDCVFRIHTKDGGYKWVSGKAVVVDRVRDVFVVNAVLMDITELQEERERLRVSEEMNRLAIEHSGNIITRFDVRSKTLTLPKAMNPIFVLPRVLNNQPEEQIALGRISPDTADTYRKMFTDISAGSAAGTATYKQTSSSGWRWLEAQYTTIFSNAGEPVSAVISFTDVTERLEKEVVYNKWQQSLSERAEDSYTLFRCNLSKDASFDSCEGTLLRVGFSDTQASFDQRTAEYVAQCVYMEDWDKYLAFLNANTMLAGYYRGHRSDSLEYREQNPDGTLRWLRLNVDLVEYPNSKDVEAYLMFEDIDRQKKVDLLTLERSETDPLTRVLNRATFISKMEQILLTSRPGEKHALLMLDVDNFKAVNDTLGHGAGDNVLTTLTGHISAILRHDDLVGRLGGDEFFVFLKNIPDDCAAGAKAQQICGIDLVEPGRGVPVTVSIGIAMVPEDGNDFDTLYTKVDAALYKRKQLGKNGFAFVGDE